MSQSIRVYRRDQIGSPGPIADGGVLQVVSSIGAMLDGECPDDELSAMIGALLGCYGTVSALATSTEYIWVECPPPDPRFKKICIDGSGYELDDGGTSPIVVKVEVHKSYPFS